MPTLSQCEFIWTSLDKPAKIARKSSTDLNRFHPTQKPEYIYRWIFEYCKVNSEHTVFDGFLGSGSIALACHDLNINLVGCEIDTDYYEAAMKRLKQHQSQLTIF